MYIVARNYTVRISKTCKVMNTRKINVEKRCNRKNECIQRIAREIKEY